MDDRLGHGHEVGVEREIDGPERLLVRGREVRVVIVPDGHRQVQEQVDLPAQRGQVRRDEVERLAQRRAPRVGRAAAQVDRVAGLVWVRLEHLQRVVVRQREVQRGGDRAVGPRHEGGARVARGPRGERVAGLSARRDEGDGARGEARRGDLRGEAQREPRGDREHLGGQGAELDGRVERVVAGELEGDLGPEHPGEREAAIGRLRRAEAPHQGPDGGAAHQAGGETGVGVERGDQAREGLVLGPRVLRGDRPRGEAPQLREGAAHRAGQDGARGPGALVGDREVTQPL